MDSLNWVAIVGTTLLGFILGPLWYGPLMFGNVWMRIHGHDKKSPAEQKKEMEGMWKLMVSEFLATLLIMTGLAWIVKATAMDTEGALHVALWVWCFFVLPMTVSNIIWGGDRKSDMPKKIAIMIAYRLIVLAIGACILVRF